MAICIHKLLCKKLTMEEWHWRRGARDFWCCERSGPWAWFVYGAMGPPWPLIRWHHSLQRTLSRPTSWASDNVKINFHQCFIVLLSTNCHRSEGYLNEEFCYWSRYSIWLSILADINFCIAMTEGLYSLIITMWTVLLTIKLGISNVVLCSLHHVYTYGTFITSFVFLLQVWSSIRGLVGWKQKSCNSRHELPIWLMVCSYSPIAAQCKYFLRCRARCSMDWWRSRRGRDYELVHDEQISCHYWRWRDRVSWSFIFVSLLCLLSFLSRLIL